ncbi:MAG: N-acyl-D-amino-acid deacylase [Clostridiales bacterium]|jgi:N-acyl-D-amino-acid deacylase|nr:N-acyl-D-amino-acid deacylase [Clostridiales bacterium]
MENINIHNSNIVEVMYMVDNTHKVLLNNGYIVDGSGKKGVYGSLLIEGGLIKDIISNEVPDNIEVIDCTGKVISPGFIDMHSHNDWFFPSTRAEDFLSPFIQQGITTFIGGNCGFGVTGLKSSAQFIDNITANPFKSSEIEISWSSLNQYASKLEKIGLPANLLLLAGHGTTRASIRGYNSSPLNVSETDEMLGLLGDAMDEGAAGVSFGLQYEPGIFASTDELKAVAALVKQKNKLITVHSRASSALSGTYPLSLFGKPHNIIALEEMINIARETGVSLQYSHLIFVGEKTWKTYSKTMNVIDKAIADGVDFKFDTFSYTCGGSVISVILPSWFMEKVPEAYENSADLKKLKLQLTIIEKLLGFGYGDIQIAYIDDIELSKYTGMFISEIAKDLGITPFEAYILCAKRSNGKARVLQYKYANLEIIKNHMKHPASIFMTDAWLETEGIQNPASYGCFPRFLQIARESKILSLEETIKKMTYSAAERLGIKDRGLLKKGYAADVTVFDWENICDNNSLKETDKTPSGIEHVFINGNHVLDKGELTKCSKCGIFIRV